MENKYFFKCVKCHGSFHDLDDNWVKCPSCEGPLTVEMSIDKLKSAITKKEFFNKQITSMWSFFEFLPLLNKKNIISLKEGNTPILKCKRLSSDLKLNNLFLKLEFLNPTGSFKDRQISLGISKAIELNKKRVITMSSGNVGASVSAYSARAGLRSIILIPSMAPEDKILQIKQYGGNVIKINSDSTKFISGIVEKASKKFKMANLITASLYNPFINKGAKTISYEIAIQMREFNLSVPDVLIIPVGGAGLLSSVYEGFKELFQLKFIDKIPRLIGVQPEGCAPFVEAIQKNLEPEYLFKHPWKSINTISTALADDIPLDCYTGIPAVKESGGNAIMVSDKETLNASMKLSTLEGIFAEPSSCTTIACIPKLLKNNQIKEDDIILCLITGFGLKDTHSIKPILPKSLIVEKDFDWEDLFQKILN